ncbi:MAG: DUF1565 domain-containing protein [Methanosarcinales archaeon]|nr:DUF1565 domain-containing protein [Methanosarcinales archaeon]
MAVAVLILLAAIQLTPSLARAQEPLSHTWYVDAGTGNDRTGAGTSASPFKTITHALSVSSSRDTVRVRRGVYDAANGETFPIRLKRGVRLEGIPVPIINGQLLPIIRGGAPYSIPSSDRGRYVTILGADSATISRFRLDSVNSPGAPPGGKDGTSILCDSTSPTITKNVFAGEGHAGITTLGTAHPLIEDNRFPRSTNWGITAYGQSYPSVLSNSFTGINGMDCSDDSHPTIQDNRISCWAPGETTSTGLSTKGQSNPTIQGNQIIANKEYGIVVRMDSTPMIQDNQITDNPTGILIAAGSPRPDLGGGGRSLGNNTFENTDWDVQNWSPTAIMARNNHWSSSPCCEHIDSGDIFDDDENSLYGRVDYGPCVMCVARLPSSAVIRPFKSR